MRFRPQLEQLEDRLTPTQISLNMVNTTAIPDGHVVVDCNVDRLYDPHGGPHGTPQVGMLAADVVIAYDPAILTPVSVILGTMGSPVFGDPSSGYSNAVPNGWSVTVSPTLPQGIEVYHIVQQNGIGLNTGRGGTLFEVAFSVAHTAPIGQVSHVDLCSTFQGGPPVTQISDNYDSAGANLQYVFPTPPQDNTTLNPYVYTGTDPLDITFTIQSS